MVRPGMDTDGAIYPFRTGGKNEILQERKP
jgi:hypothetical protein